MLKIIGEHEENTITQARNVLAKGADKFILCADGHLGYGHPIGGVAAYKDRISISGVGFDIACGNMAVKLPILHTEIKDWKAIGREINRKISFGVGRVNDTRVEAEFLDTDANWSNEALTGLKDMAAAQLGTVGSGNHYVDVFHDQDGFVWIGVHFGSRGLGHKATTHFLKKLGAQDGMNADPCIVDMKSDVGQAYFEAMNLGGQYAYAGREWVCKTVSEIIGGADMHYLDEVHNHHNFAWIEEHDGDNYFVVRKGSTPAFPDQRSFIGSNMFDKSVIVRGLDTPQAKENLYSTVHGAGRVMSRTQAAGKFKGWGRNRIRISEGLVNEDEMRDTARANGVHLFGAGADEAPQCYKKLSDVLSYHKDSVMIETELTPIVVCMAGSDVRDPYKD